MFPQHNILYLFLLFLVEYNFLYSYYIAVLIYFYLFQVYILTNTRKTINVRSTETGIPLEIDAWIPDLQLAFEYQVPPFFPSSPSSPSSPSRLPSSPSFLVSSPLLSHITIRTHTTTSHTGTPIPPSVTSRTKMISNNLTGEGGEGRGREGGRKEIGVRK